MKPAGRLDPRMDVRSDISRISSLFWWRQREKQAACQGRGAHVELFQRSGGHPRGFGIQTAQRSETPAPFLHRASAPMTSGRGEALPGVDAARVAPPGAVGAELCLEALLQRLVLFGRQICASSPSSPRTSTSSSRCGWPRSRTRRPRGPGRRRAPCRTRSGSRGRRTSARDPARAYLHRNCRGGPWHDDVGGRT